VLSADAGVEACEFELVPAEGVPVRNPAFVVKGWDGEAQVKVEGSESVVTGIEGENLVVFVEGVFGEAMRVGVERG